MELVNNLRLKIVILVLLASKYEAYQPKLWTRARNPETCKSPLAITSSSSAEAITDEDTEERASLKKHFLFFAERTDRGFRANIEDLRRINEVVDQLARLNPTSEPARAFYTPSGYSDGPSLTGRWNLVYTDAPDITSLDQGNPWASLGRIGQECDPPYIRNVIEWKRPSWLPQGLPLSGSDSDRIIQRVVTKATASPQKANEVQLELAGFRVGPSSSAAATPTDIPSAIQKKGLVAGLTSVFPLDAEGPFTAPFGKFTILYLDQELRIVRTGQGYIAANVRAGTDWM